MTANLLTSPKTRSAHALYTKHAFSSPIAFASLVFTRPATGSRAKAMIPVVGQQCDPSPIFCQVRQSERAAQKVHKIPNVKEGILFEAPHLQGLEC
jgi:hypothetical protein